MEQILKRFYAETLDVDVREVYCTLQSSQLELTTGTIQIWYNNSKRIRRVKKEKYQKELVVFYNKITMCEHLFKLIQEWFLPCQTHTYYCTAESRRMLSEEWV